MSRITHRSGEAASREWAKYCEVARDCATEDHGKFVVIVGERVFGPNESYEIVRREADAACPGRSALVMQVEANPQPISVCVARY